MTGGAPVFLVQGGKAGQLTLSGDLHGGVADGNSGYGEIFFAAMAANWGGAALLSAVTRIVPANRRERAGFACAGEVC